MNKFSVLALAAAVLTASCAGHSGSSAVPQLSSGVGGPAHKMSAGAPSGWATTGTQAVNLANAVDLGNLPAAQQLTVRVGLALRNQSQLQAAVASGQTVDPSTFMATYAPTSAQVAQVTNYLQSQGFSNISVEPNNLIVSATATAAQAQTAFDTTLHAFSINGTNVWGNVAPAYVPSSLGGTVVAVLGLSNEQAMAATPHHNPKPNPSPTPTPGPPSACSLYGLEIVGFPTGPVPDPTTQYGCTRNYYPADYWRAYDAVNAPVASKVSIAIMTAGQLGDAVSNLRVNEQSDGLVQPSVIIKPVGVAGGVISSGVDEWTLDLTASSGMARAVKSMYVYNTTSLNDSDIALMYSRWVTDNLAKIGNSSFGGCEFGPYLDGSMILDDEIFLQGASQGQTMFASSGDTGAFCPVGAGANGVPAGVPLVNYPAASPYVVAVGGTTLLTQTDGSYQGEAAWYSGGGGLSQFEYSPVWETTAQPVSKNGESMRGVPDIAMDGDLQTGMVLYDADQGGWIVIGGTSLASPLAAGSYARMLSNKPSLGFAPAHLYSNFTGNAAGAQVTGPPPWQPDGGFHDILVGANGAYTALPGYDYTTGLGSFDIGLMAQQL
ncbi:MAG TPA: S53 family peptidase [Candidatus Baltobacteraceae bacterium]|jgi:subtilase family serine protease|nr:S53 family peptidase [Candidatus Baltobacteraceae bacterium]